MPGYFDTMPDAALMLLPTATSLSLGFAIIYFRHTTFDSYHYLNITLRLFCRPA